MWRVNGEEFTEAWRVAQEITETMDDEYYDNMLDDEYGEVDICGYSYASSYVFREIDPIAYNCSKSDYYDSLHSDIESDLEAMDDGETTEIYGIEVEYVSDAWVRLENAVEHLGWGVYFYHNNGTSTIEFKTKSPLGESLSYVFEYMDIDDVFDSLRYAADNYDADEHVKKLIRTTDTHSSVRDLIDDAESIGSMLTALYLAAEEAE